MERVVICSGKKISLSILSREDAPDLFRIINDRNVNRMLRFPQPVRSLVDEYEWIDNQALTSGQNLNFSIIKNENSTLIGIIGVNDIEFNMHGKLGYFISRDNWGRGFTTEAVSLLTGYCFNVLNLRKIFAYVFEPNIASIRVLERNNFKMTGRQEEHVFVEGEGFVDSLYFEKLNPNRQKRNSH